MFYFNLNIANITLFSIVFLLNVISSQTKKDVLDQLSLETTDSVINDEQIFNKLQIIAANSSTPITITDIPPNLNNFLIVQVHAFTTNITLSYNSTLIRSNYVNGTNVGLYFPITSIIKEITFYIFNPSFNDTECLIAVNAYPNTAPIPGGCNLEFSTEFAPYLHLVYTDSLIKVDAQPASTIFETKCSGTKSNITYEMYHYFLNERDFKSSGYFNGIQAMMNVRSILENGRKVQDPILGSKMRRTYSAYRGLGEVFTVVATYNNQTSAYVPIVTYTCNENQWDDHCEVLTSPFIHTLFGILFFVGFLLCFFGHRCFKTGLFFEGFFTGSFISYIIITLTQHENFQGNLISATIIGLASGLVWLSVWSYCGIPILSMVLPNIVLGFLLASIIFYCGGADFNILQFDTNFWMMFISILFTIATMLSIVTYHGNILTTSILGSYCIILPIDHYSGSYLKYIIINIVRRAVVPDFNTAIIDPPFQIRDIAITSLWVALTLSGYYIQCLQQQGKPPFPPPPFLQRRYQNLRRIANLVASEHEPLIQRINHEPVYPFDDAVPSGARPVQTFRRRTGYSPIRSNDSLINNTPTNSRQYLLVPAVTTNNETLRTYGSLQNTDPNQIVGNKD